MKQEKTPGEKAYEIFQDWANRNNRNYFGDIVRDNLNAYIKSGYTPQQAVDVLVKKAPR